MERIGGAGFLHNVITPVDLIVPWAAVPVVVADEIQLAGSFDIESDIKIVGELIEEVRGVGALVSSLAVVRTAHVGSGSDALVRPAVPKKIGIGPDGNHRRRCRERRGREKKNKDPLHGSA